MTFQLLADAKNIEVWADRIDARHIFPKLIRKLILSTTSGIDRIDFRSGEGTQFAGLDGVVSVQIGDGNAFIPKGVSIWELGVNKDVKDKIDGDYEKRTNNPGNVEQSNTVFIFITPRRWASKEKWSKEKTNERKWKEVRVYDADDLEIWLEQAPAVHFWFSSLIEKMPEGIKDLETFWETWSNATKPPLNSKLLIAGRQALTDKIHQWLHASPSHLTVKGEREKFEEIIAIFFAAIDQLAKPERDTWISRCVIVENAQHWNTLAHSTQPLILIPTFSDRSQVLSAVKSGHHVLIPTSWNERTSQENTLSIPFLQGDLAEEVLIEMGLPKRDAPKLAILARRSLTLLRRKLAIEPALLTSADIARQFLSAVMAGGWYDEHPADQDILCRLDGRTYSEIRKNLVDWSKQPDTFIRLEGDFGFWAIVSKEDAWWHLASQLTSVELNKFKAVILDVFKAPKNSGLLKRGLAETLAVMATRSEPSVSVGGSTLEQWAERIVRELFSEVKDWQHWASLSPYFQLFAEAAPNQFLEAVDRGLSGENPVLINLFTDSEQNMGGSPHFDLLWALEILAWSPDYLTRSASLLAKLARLDSGGKMANRPINSLKTIFLSWHPYTSANLPKRLKVIDLIRKREPQIAWDLMMGLIPNPGSIFPTAKPQWREWVKEESYDELSQEISSIVQRLLEDVGTIGSRWHSLIQLLGDVPKTDFDKIVEKLQTVDVKTFSQNDSFEVWNSLRDFITEHLNLSDVGRALPKGLIEPLKQSLSRFEPENPVLKHSWLFTSAPVFPEINCTERDKYQEVLKNSRIQAIEEIYNRGGIELLFQLAEQANKELYHLVGVAIAQSHLFDGQEEGFLTQYFGSEDNLHHAVAFEFLVGRSRLKGQEWMNALRSKPFWQTWTPPQKAEYYRCLPFSKITWENLDKEEETVKQVYWQRVNICRHWWLQKEDYEIALRQLVQYEQFTKAWHFIAMYLKRTTFNPKSVAETIERIIEKVNHDQMKWNGIDDILDFLEASGEIEEERIARLEWFFMPLLQNQRDPKILHKLLAENPTFFVEVLKLTFEVEGEEVIEEITEVQNARAVRGYWLLNDWKRLPGLQDDGSIDADILRSWVVEAKRLAKNCHREEIGDSEIGKVLSHSPLGSHDQYPHESVCELIERLESEELERGFFFGIINSKSHNEGGKQEYAIAEKYRNYAKTLEDEYPRTARILEKVASSFERDAKREDNEVRLREDGFP